MWERQEAKVSPNVISYSSSTKAFENVRQANALPNPISASTLTQNVREDVRGEVEPHRDQPQPWHWDQRVREHVASEIEQKRDQLQRCDKSER